MSDSELADLVQYRGPRHIAHGVTRTVLVGRRWTVKIPRGSTRCRIRGWLANQSEWRRRHVSGVNPPLFTLLHLAVVYRTADEVRHYGSGVWDDLDGDDGHPANWGRFGDRWLLVDFDECPSDRRGVVGRIYWARREAEGRRWIALAQAEAALAAPDEVTV